MTIDLDTLSKKELEKLRGDVEKALATVEDRRRAEARAAAERAAREHGFALDELLEREKRSKKSPPKYRNPEDPRQTWTGRGRQPGWVKQALEDGRSLSDFAI